jgi:hypothetical protein
MYKLKIPVQVNVDVCTLAGLASVMRENDMPVRTKSEIIEFALNSASNSFITYQHVVNESMALDYLSKLGIGVKADNKRHKKSIDTFTLKTNMSGLVVPSNNESKRDIVSVEDVYREQARILMQQQGHIFAENARKADEKAQSIQQAAQATTNSIFGQNEPKPPMNEEERLKWKQSKGIETFNDLTQEDLESYNNYAKDCNEKGIIPASISDFLSGNIKITL